MRRSLGVDSLDVGVGTGGPMVGASRAIGDMLSVGVRTGATPKPIRPLRQCGRDAPHPGGIRCRCEGLDIGGSRHKIRMVISLAFTRNLAAQDQTKLFLSKLQT